MFVCKDGAVIFLPAYSPATDVGYSVSAETKYALRIDDRVYPVEASRPIEVQGRFIFGEFLLSPENVRALVNASKIGFAGSMPNSDFFWGFTVDVKDGRAKLQNFLRNCTNAPKEQSLNDNESASGHETRMKKEPN